VRLLSGMILSLLTSFVDTPTDDFFAVLSPELQVILQPTLGVPADSDTDSESLAGRRKAQFYAVQLHDMTLTSALDLFSVRLEVKPTGTTTITTVLHFPDGLLACLLACLFAFLFVRSWKNQVDQPMPLSWLLEVLASVARALKTAYSAGVVHLAVTTANVMIDDMHARASTLAGISRPESVDTTRTL
jgi:hypothetical protein